MSKLRTCRLSTRILSARRKMKGGKGGGKAPGGSSHFSGARERQERTIMQQRCQVFVIFRGFPPVKCVSRKLSKLKRDLKQRGEDEPPEAKSERVLLLVTVVCGMPLSPLEMMQVKVAIMIALREKVIHSRMREMGVLSDRYRDIQTQRENGHSQLYDT